MKLSPRERVKKLFAHEIPDQMPVTLDVGGGSGITTLYQRHILDPLGIEDAADYFDFDIRTVEVPLVPNGIDPEEYFSDVPEPIEIDELGVGRFYTKTFPHGLIYSPLKNVKDSQKIIDYPMPTVKVTSQTKEEITRLQDKGYAVSSATGSINEWCYYLRSMEVFFADLVNDPDAATVLLDKVTNLAAQAGAAMASAGADIVCFYGDTGGQNGMLISPQMWRQWIKPRWAEIITAVRSVNAETLIFFHSCGKIDPIIPDLIELGVDILNPVQPECMDPFQVKETYGLKINLWGGIGLQQTMGHPDPSKVKQEVVKLINAWAPGGGALVSTTNSLPLDIPWQNVKVMIETIREYSLGVYQNL